jgi:hypothetical protein
MIEASPGALAKGALHHVEKRGGHRRAFGKRGGGRCLCGGSSGSVDLGKGFFARFLSTSRCCPRISGNAQVSLERLREVGSDSGVGAVRVSRDAGVDDLHVLVQGAQGQG